MTGVSAPSHGTHGLARKYSVLVSSVNCCGIASVNLWKFDSSEGNAMAPAGKITEISAVKLLSEDTGIKPLCKMGSIRL